MRMRKKKKKVRIFTLLVISFFRSGPEKKTLITNYPSEWMVAFLIQGDRDVQEFDCYNETDVAQRAGQLGLGRVLFYPPDDEEPPFVIYLNGPPASSLRTLVFFGIQWPVFTRIMVSVWLCIDGSTTMGLVGPIRFLYNAAFPRVLTADHRIRWTVFGPGLMTVWKRLRCIMCVHS